MSRTVVFDLDTQHAHMNVRRACVRARVACGLATNVVKAGVPIHAPLQFDPYAITQHQGTKADARRHEFADWVFTNALRDVSEAFEVFLDYAHARLQDGLILKGKDRKSAVKEHNKYTRMACKAKSEVLVQIDPSLVVPYWAEFETITAFRNCVSHRRGIVHETDVNDPVQRALVLRWLGFDWGLILDDGSSLPITAAAPEGGAIVQATVVARSRKFELGTRVGVTPEEIAEMLMSYDRSAEVFAGHLQRVVLSWFPNAHVLPTSPKVPGIDLR